MHVVCRNQTDSELSRDLWQYAVGLALLLNSMVVQFDEKVLLPENVPVLGGTLFGLLNIVCLNRAVHFARETTAQSNQTGRARCEQLLVNPWRVMKSIQMPRCYQLYEVSIASVVFG